MAQPLGRRLVKRMAVALDRASAEDWPVWDNRIWDGPMDKWLFLQQGKPLWIGDPDSPFFLVQDLFHG